MRVIIAKHNDVALVFWKGATAPYVVVQLEVFPAEVGDFIGVWYHGDYHQDLKKAVAAYEKRAGIGEEDA